MDSATDFDLIGLPQIRRVKLSSRPVPAAQIAGRSLVLRTADGRFAKMHVRSGDIGADSGRPEMTIDRYTFYEIDSCVFEMASGVRLRSGRSLDLAAGRESRTGGNLRWHPGLDGKHVLEPLNGATLALLPRTFDPANLRAARVDPKRVRIDEPGGKTVYVRTRRGRLARLIVESGRSLRIRELTVLDEEGDVHIQRHDILVPAGKTLDLDTGKLGGTAHYDLRHHVEAAGGGRYMSAADRVTFVPSHHFTMLKYDPLLNSEAIRDAMIWRDEVAGSQTYDEWSEARKAQLREWLYLRETGQDFPIDGPPPLNPDGVMAYCAAWKIYLAHVVQSLWADANRKVPWRLLDASEEHLLHLFDSSKLIAFTDKGPRSLAMGIITPWCPVFCWKFMRDNDYIGTTQWETIKRLTEWSSAHLRHIWGYEFNQPGGPFDSQEDQWDWQYGYRGPPPVDKMIEPLPGREHVAHACSGMSAFFAAVLRAVNVPVRHGYTNLSANGHHRPEFFSVDRNLAHGDDPYTTTILPGINSVPIHRLFYTNAEIEELIDNPEPMPGKTVGETAAFNHGRKYTGLAVEYKTRWLLRKRCLDQASGASGPESEVGMALSEFYSAEEIEDIEAACDAELATIDGGCSNFP
jgi:hypothetical protein